MKTKTQANNETYLYRILCVLTGVVALFPVSCNYIMSGGIVTEWIARVEELGEGLRAGQLYLFPSAEVFIRTGIKVNGMNSNFWFFFPALLYRLSGNVVFVYRIYMLVIQVVTLLGAILLFRRVFAGEETKQPCFFATLLYMTCPYRIYVCYDLANISQATAWVLVPFYVWALAGLMRKDENQNLWRTWFLNIVIAALTLAGIGYADTAFFMILAGITLFIGLVLRKPWSFVPLFVGSGFFLPGLYRLIQYLFRDGYAELDMPLKTIMPNGYRFGEYFSSYSFRNGHPGMGLGMLVCLLAGAWLKFVENNGEKHKICRFFGLLSILFVFFSFYYFPWDLFQRFGIWALKLVSLIDTPAVFWGMGFLCLCVPAACAMNRIRRHENKIMAFAITLMVMIACIGVCVFQCNTLTYNRLPLTYP